MVYEIDHMSDLHVDSSFYKQSMKINNYHKITEWIDSSVGQSTVIQQLDKKDPSYPIQIKCKTGGDMLILKMTPISFAILNLNNPESTVFISFKMINIASGNQEFVNSLIGNTTGKIIAKLITFYRTYSGLGLLISKAQVGSYIAIANDGSSSIKPDLKFPSSKSNCSDLNKWHVTSVTWSNRGENLSNCWSNGEKLMTFTTGNIKGSDYCYIGDPGIMSGLKNNKKRSHTQLDSRKQVIAFQDRVITINIKEAQHPLK